MPRWVLWLFGFAAFVTALGVVRSLVRKLDDLANGAAANVVLLQGATSPTGQHASADFAMKTVAVLIIFLILIIVVSGVTRARALTKRNESRPLRRYSRD